jgi:hypothetical protein
MHNKLASVGIASYSGVVSIYFAHEVTHLDACIPRTALIIQATERQKYSVRKHSPTVKQCCVSIMALVCGRVIKGYRWG